jgi:segregation and condensation protein A
VFEGPLDLLLYLIRRDRIDIHDIPIAPITRQYMEYLDLMRELNLDVAGDFMVMAATLIHIKARMLVPVDPTEAQGEEELEDPRDALVQRLLEFQRYKEAAGVLHQKAEIRAATWTRPDAALPQWDEAGEEMLEAGLFDLVSAFKELLERRKTLLAHEIADSGQSVDERMEELMELIREGESVEFLELFASQETKADMIVTFLALLELIRIKRVKVYQRGVFGAIRVFRPVGPDAAVPVG